MSKILELDITLNESNPQIWRRVLAPADFNFYELHYVIQFSMGWTHSHLHQFIVGQRDRCIGMAYDGDFDAMEMEDGSKIKISEILKKWWRNGTIWLSVEKKGKKIKQKCFKNILLNK